MNKQFFKLYNKTSFERFALTLKKLFLLCPELVLKKTFPVNGKGDGTAPPFVTMYLCEKMNPNKQNAEADMSTELCSS